MCVCFYMFTERYKEREGERGECEKVNKIS